MKKTRILAFIITLCMVLSCVLVACHTTCEKHEDANHDGVCDVCGQKGLTVTHTGGTATCLEKAKCEVCGAEYGELAAHQITAATCAEKAICAVCGQEFADALPHTDANYDLKCDECGAAISSWVNDTKNYTWRVGPSSIPTDWNVHTYQTNESTYILDYTSDSLYVFDYNETGDRFRIVPSMASDNPKDVSAEYVGKFDVQEGDEGKVYEIPLKQNLRYDNGDTINANSFVRSMLNLLNPKAGNQRANNVYKESTLKIFGAENYAKQGSITWGDVTQGEGIGKGIYTGWDKEKADGGVSEEIANNIYFIIHDCYVGNWFMSRYGDDYGSYVDQKGMAWTLVNLFGLEVPVADVEALEGLTLAEIAKDEALSATLQYLLYEFWCTDPDEEFGFFCTKDTWADYSFDDVGFFAKDDYTLVVVLKNAMPDNFYLRYELCTSFFLVHNGMYENCISEEGGVYTNNFATSVDTYIGFGPYKLTAYQADNRFLLERNPNWHGYYEAEHQGQYQTTAIEYKVVSNDATRREMFLKGELDSYGLLAEDMEDYISSKYTYFQESMSTWFVAMNPSVSNYETTQATATPEIAGNTVIKTPMSLTEFRQAMSYSLDRTAFIVACNPTSGVAKALLSSQMISDPDNGEAYRQTEAAKDAILDFWGLADEVGPGKEYETKDEAINSITGYDPAGAKALFTAAYNKSVENGWITEEMIASGKWELQILFGASNWESKFYSNGFDFLSKNWIDAVKGTPFEGHLTCKKSESYGSNAWANKLKDGTCDILFGVGYSGSQFNPYSFMDVFTGNLQYDAFTDKEKVIFDIEINGQVLRGSLAQWVSALGGTPFNAAVVVDGEVTDQKVEFSAGVEADMNTRVLVMAKCEVTILNLCNLFPLMTDASASLRCMRINYKTEDYLLGLGRGGLQYYTYSYSDEEFAAFVKEQGGTLNYKVTE